MKNHFVNMPYRCKFLFIFFLYELSHTTLRSGSSYRTDVAFCWSKTGRVKLLSFRVSRIEETLLSLFSVLTIVVFQPLHDLYRWCSYNSFFFGLDICLPFDHVVFTPHPPRSTTDIEIRLLSRAVYLTL